MIDDPSASTDKQIPPISQEAVRNLEMGEGPRDLSLLEAKQINSGASREELAEQAEKAEYRRNERFRDHFEVIAVIGLYVVSALFLVVGATWFWHLLSPEKWHYLTADQVGKLQNIVTGGIIASLGADHIKKRLR